MYAGENSFVTRKTAAESRISTFANVNLPLSANACRCAGLPQSRLSTPTMRAPLPSSSSTTCEPRKPAAPVTIHARSVPIESIATASHLLVDRFDGGDRALRTAMRLDQRAGRPPLEVLASHIAQHRDCALDQPVVIIRDSRVYAILGRKALDPFGRRDHWNSDGHRLENFYFHSTAANRSVEHDPERFKEGQSVRNVLDDLDARQGDEIAQRAARRPSCDPHRDLGQLALDCWIETRQQPRRCGISRVPPHRPDQSDHRGLRTPAVRDELVD